MKCGGFVDPRELIARKLCVEYEGEDGVDDSGLTVDFFVTLVHAFVHHHAERDQGGDWVEMTVLPDAPFYYGQEVRVEDVTKRARRASLELIKRPWEGEADEPSAMEAPAGSGLVRLSSEAANRGGARVVGIDEERETLQVKMGNGTFTHLPFDAVTPLTEVADFVDDAMLETEDDGDSGILVESTDSLELTEVLSMGFKLGPKPRVCVLEGGRGCSWSFVRTVHSPLKSSLLTALGAANASRCGTCQVGFEARLGCLECDRDCIRERTGRDF